MQHIQPIPVTPKQVVIGIKATVGIGCKFYYEIEQLMAKLWPNETSRPCFYLDLGPATQSNSNLLSNPQIDFVLLVTKKYQTDRSHSSLSAKELISHILLKGQSNTEYQYQLDHLPAMNDYRVKLINGPLQPSITQQSLVRIGIIGGMGPLACANFMIKLADGMKKNHLNTQEYALYVYSNPASPQPNFNNLIVNFWNNDSRDLLTYRHRLSEFGNRDDINFYIAPSNTLHTSLSMLSLFRILKQEKFIHIVQAAAIATSMRFPNVTEIGLMATERTSQAGIYTSTFAYFNKSIVYQAHLQHLINEGISLVKQGDYVNSIVKFDQVIGNFFQQGIKVILLGCTEIDLGIDKPKWEGHGIQFIDSATNLVEATIAKIQEVDIEYSLQYRQD